MKHLVIGTAGHIDHGKTTLIKKLTGIETDTMKEEQVRGMSINLGFAYLDLPDGERIGIVDVPGHEKFIKNMLAGVAGIDLVLLVIDANEGIMPQTREHMDILGLLGIEHYIVVLTKVATIEEELRELVYEDLRESLAGTPLEHSPVIETDAMTGLGLDALKAEIFKQSTVIQGLERDSSPRLNIDRSFSVKGFGTVVTGTLIDGTVSVGDDLILYPAGLKTKVRSIQVHEEAQEKAFPGQRTALNITKIGVEDVGRGDVLTTKDNVESSWLIDAKVRCLKSAPHPIQLWDRCHLHVGTTEVRARIVPLGMEEIPQGGEGFIQLRLEEKVAVKQGDHFILRSYSPVVTIAGGVVLEATPQKHRRFNQENLASLKIKEEGNFEDVLLDYLIKKSDSFVTAKVISEYLNENLARVKDSLDDLVENHLVFPLGQTFIAMDKLETIGNEMLEVVGTYHKKNRLRKGMPLEEFRSKFSALKNKESDAIIRYFCEEEKLVVEQDQIRLAEFQVVFNSFHLAEKERIEKMLFDAGLVIPTMAEITQGNQNAAEVLEALNGDTLFYLDFQTPMHMTVYTETVEKVKEHITTNGELTLGDFRDMMQTSRKYSMIFLEHLDDIGVTKRVENTRILGEVKPSS